MGNKSIYCQESVLNMWKDVFELLQLTEVELSALLGKFRSYPIDNAILTISVRNLQDNLCQSEVKYPTTILGMMDDGKSGDINFGEFVCVLWLFCTLSFEQLAEFIFEIYDKKCASFLNDREVSTLLFDLHGSDLHRDDDLLALWKQMASVEHGSLHVSSFAAFASKYPRLLEPLHILQQHLRQSILGHAFWEQISITRRNLTEVVVLSKLRLMLMKSRYKLLKPSLSTKIIRAASAKVSKAMSKLSHKRIHPDDTVKCDSTNRCSEPPDSKRCMLWM